jgi:hypothetical protein
MSFKSGPHDKGISDGISELLVLDDVSASSQDRASHGMHDARLIRALQRCY